MPSLRLKSKKQVVLNIVLLPVAAQDVVGCGGFVESTVPIKYEKVEVYS